MRNVIVLAGLLGSLVLTSIILLLMEPRALWPGEAGRIPLFQVLDSVVEPRVPVQGWQSIYIHHSRTRDGNAATLAIDPSGLGDHFLIGNGNGCGDGEIQISQRWNAQHPARPPGRDVDKNCISICLVGDFDAAAPTAPQMRRLGQLVAKLQSHCGISAANVVISDTPSSPAGIGRHFPRGEFGKQLQ